jgi:hypothetical protein
MKKTFEFRYHQNKFNGWHIKRKWILFGFIPIWINYLSLDDMYFFSAEITAAESEILNIISRDIKHEKKLASHKNVYKTVNENSFNKTS